jgi:hypothetical protein
MNQTARLIVTNQCHGKCPQCVNQVNTDVRRINFRELSHFEEVIITGGEPLEYFLPLYRLLIDLKIRYSNIRTILYSRVPDYFALSNLTYLLDGITISIMTDEDLDRFNDFNHLIRRIEMKRARIFYKNITHKLDRNFNFIYKMVDWKESKNCSLPINEQLFEHDPLFENIHQKV